LKSHVRRKSRSDVPVIDLNDAPLPQSLPQLPRRPDGDVVVKRTVSVPNPKKALPVDWVAYEEFAREHWRPFPPVNIRMQ